jgi:ketosteroid isomerase-like protein
MAEESEQLARMRSAVELWNARRYEEVLAYLHPDVIWRLDRFFPDLEPVYEGRDGVRRFFQDFVEPWEEISIGIDEVIDEREGQIFLKVRFEARGREGMEVDVHFPQIYRFDRDNMVTEFHGIVDEEAARREAGLSG